MVRGVRFHSNPIKVKKASDTYRSETVQEPDLRELGHLYLIWCHNQPLVLFDANTFVESLPRRDRELILALQTLALRFPPGSLKPQDQERLSSMAKESRNIVMNRLADGQVNLSTLQTLCILSMVDFTGWLSYQVQTHRPNQQSRWQDSSGFVESEHSKPSCTKSSSELCIG